MALLDVFRPRSSRSGDDTAHVEAAIRLGPPSPAPYPPGAYSSWTTSPYVSREAAVQVPAVARALNVIAGTIGTLPIHLYSWDGRRLPEAAWMKQPDAMVPRVVTVSWTIQDLILHGVAYWQVTDVFAETGRPARFQRVDPRRVGYRLDASGLVVTAWTVDGTTVPMVGLGSLVVFAGIDDGILRRGGRTILAALELERAALRYAEEPLPSVILKNQGIDLPDDQVDRLLDRWKAARAARSTAYLSSSVEAQPMGFSPEQLQLVAAREHVATEVARLMNIPARYVGASSGDSMTYSNTLQQRRDLVDFSLRAPMAAIEERLSMDDITTRGLRVRFSLDDFLRSDPLERADYYARLLPLGIISVEEARRMEELTNMAPGAPV